MVDEEVRTLDRHGIAGQPPKNYARPELAEQPLPPVEGPEDPFGTHPLEQGEGTELGAPLMVPLEHHVFGRATNDPTTDARIVHFRHRLPAGYVPPQPPERPKRGRKLTDEIGPWTW